MFKFFESCESYVRKNFESVEEQDEEYMEYVWQVFIYDQTDPIEIKAAELEEDKRGFMFRDKKLIGVAYFTRASTKYILRKIE